MAVTRRDEKHERLSNKLWKVRTHEASITGSSSGQKVVTGSPGEQEAAVTNRLGRQEAAVTVRPGRLEAAVPGMSGS